MFIDNEAGVDGDEIVDDVQIVEDMDFIDDSTADEGDDDEILFCSWWGSRSSIWWRIIEFWMTIK